MPRPVPSSGHHVSGSPSADDLLIGIALTTTWMLLTGRRLRGGVPLPHDLTAAELIDFWADDHLEPSPDTDSGLPERALHDPHSSAVRHHVA